MMDRPALTVDLKYDVFLEYYYLKEELVGFCRENGLAASGGKKDLTERIAQFLKTGVRMAAPSVSRKNSCPASGEIRLDSIIEDNFVCSEKHRAFFKEVIGEGFSFHVAFQKYLKGNAGRLYSDAVKEWYLIQEDKKKNKGKSQIDSQFEYNTYIRDFFKDNDDKTLKDAIQCWKYKKGLPGHNKYEKADLTALI